MAFVDKTYFTGELHIASLDKVAVQDELADFISIHETDCCTKLFGYEFFKQFTDGLSQQNIEQKWIDLRDGCEFTGYNGRKKIWMGLTGTSNAMPAAAGMVILKPQMQIQVDVTPGFIHGTTSVTFDGTNGTPDFRGYKIIPERIGTGTMWNTDYNWNPNTAKWDLLKADDIFQPLEKFNLQFEKAGVSVNNGALHLKRSIIANYVYCKWQVNKATTTTGVGEAAPQAENAVRTGPGDKIQKANIQMLAWVQEFREFMNQRRSDYPDFFYHTMPSEFFRSQNVLNI